jgi:hypothetical protein
MLDTILLYMEILGGDPLCLGLVLISMVACGLWVATWDSGGRRPPRSGRSPQLRNKRSQRGSNQPWGY